MTAILPYANHLIGNPTLPAIHGGVLGAFMEMTALAQLSIAQESGGERMARQPKPIDVTVEYLRSGRPVDTFARAQITRMGRRIANVRVEAWQAERAAPIAALHGHFLLTLADV
jgi:acyl-coenzyme A thioesterase PaaI-like protein